MRVYGSPPRRGIRYADRPGAYALILRGREILLAAQNGKLLLPGGGIDPGETPLQALHREVWEETGWRVAPVRRLGHAGMFEWSGEKTRWERKVQHLYICAPVRPLSAPYEPDHIPIWMNAREAAPRLHMSAERAALAAVLAGARSL